MADDAEQQDLVDVFYRPLVRPLGNLVITFAQAEASLLELVTELDGTEENARRILKNLDDTALERVIELIKTSGLTAFDLPALLEAAVSFWKDRERRNRYIHDEWFPDLTTGAPMTRGLPRKRAATIMFDAPSRKRSGRSPSDSGRTAACFRSLLTNCERSDQTIWLDRYAPGGRARL